MIYEPCLVKKLFLSKEALEGHPAPIYEASTVQKEKNITLSTQTCHSVVVTQIYSTAIPQKNKVLAHFISCLVNQLLKLFDWIVCPAKKGAQFFFSINNIF